jgi:DNA polymerase III epsilon subunit-like protein
MTKLLVIDTETGGIDPDRYSILSIGLVVWEDGMLKAELEVLIAEPDFVVTPRALEINRIDLVSHSKKAVAPTAAMVAIENFLNQHFQDERAQGEKIVLAGHNVSFDIAFFRRLCRLASADFDALFSHRVLDTASILRFLALAGQIPENTAASSNAFAHFKIPFKELERHTALGDAKATGLLLSALIEQVTNAPSPRSISAAA